MAQHYISFENITLSVCLFLLSVVKLITVVLAQPTPTTGTIQLAQQPLQLVAGPRGEGQVFSVMVLPVEVELHPVTVADYSEFSADSGKGIELFPFLLEGEPVLSQQSEIAHPVLLGHPAQAEAYCAWKGGRLLKESEWLLAACGSDGRVYPWGNEWLENQANVNSAGLVSIHDFPGDVGANGLRGVVGNSVDLVLADDPQIGHKYALRGGGWDLTNSAARCDSRVDLDPSYEHFMSLQVGFRCAYPVK